MTFLLPLLMFAIIFACVATSYSEGMWSNAVKLINIIVAALLAINYFEPVAKALEGWQPTFTFVWDFLSLWGLFAFILVILRLLTDRLSRVQVRFLKIVDRVGSGVLSVWIGWIMVCFTMLSLHVAPLGRNPLFEGFKPEDRMILGLAPDRQMLGFMQKMSMGTFCCTASIDNKEKYVFDPRGEFMPKYATRRTNIENHIANTQSLRTNAP